MQKLLNLQTHIAARTALQESFQSTASTVALVSLIVMALLAAGSPPPESQNFSGRPVKVTYQKQGTPEHFSHRAKRLAREVCRAVLPS